MLLAVKQIGLLNLVKELIRNQIIKTHLIVIDGKTCDTSSISIAALQLEFIVCNIYIVHVQAMFKLIETP